MPLYSGICPVCSTPFERQSRVRAKYCSEACMEKGRRRRPRQERIPGREATCIVCQRRFIHHQGARNQVVCSRRCSSDGRSVLLALVHLFLPPNSIEIICPLNWRTCVDCETEWLEQGKSGGPDRCLPCGGMHRKQESLAYYYRVTKSRDGYGQREGVCPECGVSFNGHGRTFCSRRCAARAGGSVRRAMERGASSGQRVYRAKVFARDGFRCHICGKLLDMGQSGTHRMAPSIDHVVPVSLGGKHTMENVRAAHFGCNSRRGNRGVGQLVML